MSAQGKVHTERVARPNLYGHEFKSFPGAIGENKPRFLKRDSVDWLHFRAFRVC